MAVLRHCSKECPSFKPFICKRRDRSHGACNGCERYKRCRFDKYKYEADAAQKEYAEMFCDARAGVNATVNEIRDLGLLIKPLLEQGSLSMSSVRTIRKSKYPKERCIRISKMAYFRMPAFLSLILI